jgi:hypothetical protein
MSKITGTVFKVYPSKFKKGMYQIKLDEFPVYYNTNKPGAAEPGVRVTFEAEPYNEKQWDVKGPVEVLTASPAAAPVSAGGNLSGGARDASIQYQSSRKDAIQFLELLVTAGALDISKAKQAAKVEILEAALDKYTASFYDDIGNLGAITRLETPDEPAAPVADDPDEE